MKKIILFVTMAIICGCSEIMYGYSEEFEENIFVKIKLQVPESSEELRKTMERCDVKLCFANFENGYIFRNEQEVMVSGKAIHINIDKPDGMVAGKYILSLTVKNKSGKLIWRYVSTPEIVSGENNIGGKLADTEDIVGYVNKTKIYGSTVEIEANIIKADKMKIGNSIKELEKAKWIPYAKTIDWDFGVSNDKNKTVYLKFRNIKSESDVYKLEFINNIETKNIIPENKKEATYDELARIYFEEENYKKTYDILSNNYSNIINNKKLMKLLVSSSIEIGEDTKTKTFLEQMVKKDDTLETGKIIREIIDEYSEKLGNNRSIILENLRQCSKNKEVCEKYYSNTPNKTTTNKLWEIRLGAEYNNSNNINNGTSNTTLTDLDNRQVPSIYKHLEDSGFLYYAKGCYKFILSKNFKITPDISYSAQNFQKNSELGMSTVKGGIEALYLISENTIIAFPVNYYMNIQDSKQSESVISGGIKLQLSMSELLNISPQLEYRRVENSLNGYNGSELYFVTANQSKLGDSNLEMGILYMQKNYDIEKYNMNSIGLFSEIGFDVFKAADVKVMYELNIDNYSALEENYKKKRADLAHKFNIGIEKEFFNFMTITLEDSFVINNSNMKLYEYSGNKLSLSAELKF